MEPEKIVTLDGESTVSGLFARFLAHQRTKYCAGTVKNETGATAQFVDVMGDLKMTAVNVERADAWKVYLLQRYASNTARLRVCIVKAAFSYAVAMRVLAVNPFQEIELPRTTHAGRVLDDKTLRLFLHALPPTVRRIVTLAAYTGMRRREIVLLDWAEIQRGRVVLAPARTKNRKGRTVYLHPLARRCLGTRRQGRVYPVSLSYVNQWVTRTWRRLGIGRVRIHDMRHTAAMRHFERNHDEYAMMKAFGWSSIEATYPFHQNVTDERVKKSMGRIRYAL